MSDCLRPKTDLGVASAFHPFRTLEGRALTAELGRRLVIITARKQPFPWSEQQAPVDGKEQGVAKNGTQRRSEESFA
jgi:hypothetical protein